MKNNTPLEELTKKAKEIKLLHQQERSEESLNQSNREYTVTQHHNKDASSEIKFT